VVRTLQAYNERLNEQTEHRLIDEKVRIDQRLRRNKVFHGLHGKISSFTIKKVLEYVESLKHGSTTSIRDYTNSFSR